MEQIKLEIQKLYKALDKLETRFDKIKNLKVDQNAEDNSDIKKEFLNLRNKVTRLINLGSSCMYPANISSKLNEIDILSGKLEPTNEGYAIAKIAVSKLCQFAKKEFQNF